MKIAIDCIHYPISDRLASHRSSWARYWKWVLQTQNPDAEIDILKRGDESKWKDYDRVYFYQGMEWSGTLNIAGGIQDWHYDRFKAYKELVDLSDSEGKIGLVSLEVPMPDYYELLKKRKIDLPYLKGLNTHVATAKLPDSEDIVLGDSHSLSVMDSKGKYVKVYRTDFKTLNGALNLGIKNVHNIDWSKIKKVTLFFGMIDLRHHVMRHGGFTAIDKLMERYETQIRELLNDDIKVELAEMYPMTPNDRKLPKSGYFEGEPFAGTIEERIGCVDYFNKKLSDIADRLKLDFYKQPEIFSLPDGTMDVYFMEKPRSVHMSSEFYRFDLESGMTREW